MPHRHRRPRRHRHHKPPKIRRAYVLDVYTDHTAKIYLLGNTVRVRHATSFTPIVGQLVSVTIKPKGGMFITAPVSAGAIGDAPPPEAYVDSRGPYNGTIGPIRPIYTGTFAGGLWTPGGLRSDTAGAVGAAYFADGLRKPAATYAMRLRFTPTTPRVVLVLLTARVRPPSPNVQATAPALTGLIPGQSITWDVPDTWVDALNAGTAGGVGIKDSTAPGGVTNEGDSLSFFSDWSYEDA